MEVIEEYAPLSLSRKMIEKGSYDNSGIIVKSGDNSQKILFSLELSSESVKKAVELKCDTIVTHHPAIYTPVSNLSIDGNTAPIISAIKAGINVVSMHLNLDVAKLGVDEYLSLGLGGKDAEILDCVINDCGYGRQAIINKTTLKDFKVKLCETFGTDKVLIYGQNDVCKIASFCGGGASEALKAVESGLVDADTIVTSDVAHHVLLGLIERGKNVVILPHYVSEQYGFNKFYLSIKEKLENKAEVFYFIDKRFM